MKKRILFLGICLMMLVSCIAESNNFSPLAGKLNEDSFSDFNDVVIENNAILNKNVYASEISKITTSFPDTSSEKFNHKVDLLKYEIQYYLEVNNHPKLEVSARKKVISTYKKIQGLLKNLPEEEREIVKIHLVKIKTNLTKLTPPTSY